jgi:hypothetical protein
MMRWQAGAVAMFLFLVTGAAHAQGGARAGSAGGIGFTFGGGFAFDNDYPSTFRLGPRGWLWLHSADKVKVGLSLPLALGLGSYDRGSFRRAITLFEVAPSVKGALQLSPLIRPYAEFGVGPAIVSVRDRFREFSDTRASVLIRTAVGVEFTPPKVEGLVVIFELFGVHARVAGFSGAEGILLVGVGYEL